MDLERARQFFIDPKDPGTSEVLVKLGSQAIKAMADTYASGGGSERIFSDTNNLNGINSEVGPAETLNRVAREILEKVAGTRRFDEKFMGQIHPQGNVIGILSMLIAAYMDTNTILKEASIPENQMEKEVLEWFAEIFGYDINLSDGNIVTGGTEANLTSLWIARDKKIAQLKAQGRWYSRFRTKLYVLGSAMNHYSIRKSCYLLGPDVEFISTPHCGYKSSADNMREAVQKLDLQNSTIMAVIGIAGETETGMIDDLDKLADLAQNLDTHFHVDAAYGGPFILSSANSRFKGIQRADTITVDPHKMLYTPYPAGVYLIRDRADQAHIDRAFREEAGYLMPEEIRKMIDNSERNYGTTRVTGSLGSGGVIATWATIRLFGKEGISTLLNHTIELTNYAFNKVSSSKYLAPLHKPETNTLLAAIKSENGLSSQNHRDIATKARAGLEANHGFYLSTDDRSIFGGKVPFRLVFMHPFTTFRLVDEAIEKLDAEVGRQLQMLPVK